jgi:chromosome segregation ATPase
MKEGKIYLHDECKECVNQHEADHLAALAESDRCLTVGRSDGYQSQINELSDEIAEKDKEIAHRILFHTERVIQYEEEIAALTTELEIAREDAIKYINSKQAIINAERNVNDKLQARIKELEYDVNLRNMSIDTYKSADEYLRQRIKELQAELDKSDKLTIDWQHRCMQVDMELSTAKARIKELEKEEK